MNGERIQGACVELAAVMAPIEGEDSPWNVLAYAVKLEGRGAELTRLDFEQCVTNFARMGKPIPVVLFHADTDAMSHPLAREAHAWITEMRVGSMMRAGRSVATLEARFRWVNAETRASVERGALAFGSITLVQNAVDEESGEDIGSFLWSFSLTNNPALLDMPRIAAERASDTKPSDGHAPPMTRGTPPAPLSHMENLMQEVQFIALAARLGIASASEDEARRVILARAEESHTVRRQLGLSADVSVKDVETAIVSLTAEAAKVAVLSAENEALKVRESERAQREVVEHVDALCLDATMAKARPALEAFARADYAAFAKAYPKPVSLGANADLTRRVTAEGSEKPTEVLDKRVTRHNDAAHEAAMKLMAEKPGTTYEVALRSASRTIAQKGMA